MKIIVISLLDSKSRRKYILERLSALGFEFEFLDGTTPKDLQLNKQNSAIAIWDSHVRSMANFLESDEECCLILEDDVDLDSDVHIKVKVLTNLQKIMKCLPEGFSIIQFGNMGFKERNYFATLSRNLFFIIFQRHHFDVVPFKKLKKSLGRARHKMLQRDLNELTGVRAKPLEGFVTGAQAYLLNRSAAEFLIEDYSKRTDWNVHSRFSLDTFLEISSNSASTPPQIRTVRLARSIFQQRPIESTNTQYPF